MRRVLFVDGPEAGRWKDVPDDLRSWVVVTLTPPMVYGNHLCRTPVGDPREVVYHPVKVKLSGWRIGLVFYQAYRESYLPRGTVLPGQVIGERLEAWSIDGMERAVEDHRRGWTS